MNTQYNLKIPEFHTNIPVLDREFDASSKEVDDFIISHRPAQNDDFYTMRFCEIAEKMKQ